MERAKALKAMKAIRERWGKLFTSGITLTIYQSPFWNDAPAKGPMWVSRVNLPSNGDHSIVSTIEEAIKILGDGSETYDIPECVDIQGEWVGHRSGADKSTVEPKIPEEEKYNRLAKELENDSVLYYVHGGAGYAGSNASSRPMMSKLATLSRSRVFAVNYRLCPQSPFPAQIVDVLLGYLYLLYPPPGSLHAPVPASKIAFVGDSFGAVLFLALTKVILTLRSHKSHLSRGLTILFRGQNVSLPLPTCLALISPYSYTPDTFPSWETNTIYDWFPVIQYPIIANPSLKSCELWPTKPLRGDLYCNIPMLGHPLICLAANHSWEGCPPVYIASGQERCIDGARAIATQMIKDGVTVCWEEYEAMPHVFMSFLPQWKQGNMCYERWVAFVRKCLEGREFNTEGFMIGCEDLKVREADVRTLTEFAPEYARRMIEVRKKERIEWLETFRRAKSLL